MAGTYKVNGDKLTGLTVYSTLPIGTPLAWLSDNLPVGFLKFDGSEYNQSDYPELYAIVQNIPAFQSETSGKFKIPDLSGRVLQGADSVLGALLEAGLPNITGSITLNDDLGFNGSSGAFSESNAKTRDLASNRSSSSPHTADFDASQSNPIYSDDCDTVQPPAFTVNWIIKAVDYVSLPQNAIDDEHTTTGNAWSADKIAEYVQNYNKLSDYEEVDASEFGNSEATAYEAEYDGFFFIDCLDGSGSKYSYMQVKTVEGTIRRFFALAGGGGKQSYSMPVNKGDKIWYEERSNSIAYYFRYYKNR